MSALEASVGAASRWSARLGGAVILLSALLVTAEVVLRNLPATQTVTLHSFDLTHWGFAAAVAFGFAHALASRAHIRIDVLYALGPLWLRAGLDALSMLAMAAMASVMAWHAWGVVLTSLRLGARPNSTLDVPLALPQGIWAVGLTWFAAVAVLLAAVALVRLATGRLDALHRAAGAQGEGMTAEDLR